MTGFIFIIKTAVPKWIPFQLCTFTVLRRDRQDQFKALCNGMVSLFPHKRLEKEGCSETEHLV